MNSLPSFFRVGMTVASTSSVQRFFLLTVFSHVTAAGIMRATAIKMNSSPAHLIRLSMKHHLRCKVSYTISATHVPLLGPTCRHSPPCFFEFHSNSCPLRGATLLTLQDSTGRCHNFRSLLCKTLFCILLQKIKRAQIRAIKRSVNKVERLIDK